MGVRPRVGYRFVAGASFPAFAAVYAALFSAYGLESPFLPSFFAERGLTPVAISLVLSCGTAARLLAGPAFGYAADRFDATKPILAVTALGAASVGLAYLLGHSLWPILLVGLLHSAVLAPLNPLADTLALSANARGTLASYGWVRGLGSAAFIVGTLASGQLVTVYGLPSIIVSSSLLFLVLAGATLNLPSSSRRQTEAWSSSDLRDLLKIIMFRRLLVAAGLIMGSHAMSDTFAVIHWRAAGIEPGAISFLWSEAVVAEVVTFFLLGPKLLARYGPGRCAALAAGAGVVRWALFAASSSLVVLAGGQLLHGLTFALLHLACMRLIVGCVPAHMLASAQSLYGTLSIGLVSVITTLLSGSVYQQFGARGFWLMALLCLAAAPVAWSLRLPDETTPHAS